MERLNEERKRRFLMLEEKARSRDRDQWLQLTNRILRPSTADFNCISQFISIDPSIIFFTRFQFMVQLNQYLSRPYVRNLPHGSNERMKRNVFLNQQMTQYQKWLFILEKAEHLDSQDVENCLWSFQRVECRLTSGHIGMVLPGSGYWAEPWAHCRCKATGDILLLSIFTVLIFTLLSVFTFCIVHGLSLFLRDLGLILWLT